MSSFVYTQGSGKWSLSESRFVASENVSSFHSSSRVHDTGLRGAASSTGRTDGLNTRKKDFIRGRRQGLGTRDPDLVVVVVVGWCLSC